MWSSEVDVEKRRHSIAFEKKGSLEAYPASPPPADSVDRGPFARSNGRFPI